MRYFFADSQDLVDPKFDFALENWGRERVRQRHEAYAHEVFKTPAYDGLLISKGIVSGVGGGSRFSLAQRHRLRRLGAREFYRLHRVWDRQLPIMGDCGAFTYVREELPPYSVDEVVDFYLECGVDLGISVDHVILAYHAAWDRPGQTNDVPLEIRRRQEITLELAVKFLARQRGEKLRFEAVGVAQGWSPKSYAFAVHALQEMGYRYVALGGMVPLKTQEILACLEAISAVRLPDTKLHLLGVTRVGRVADFAGYGVASFDSTSPLRQAFKDDRDNYWTIDGAYTAVRVPQVEGNPKLLRRIRAGQMAQRQARTLELRCLEALRSYDAGLEGIETVLTALTEYETLYDGGRTRAKEYRTTLEDQPWKKCPCDVCRQIGYHVILFRGAERNRRRGFHNLWTFYQQLRRGLGQTHSQTVVTGGNPKQKPQLPLFG